jgi:hypothetical protein
LPEPQVGVTGEGIVDGRDRTAASITPRQELVMSKRTPAPEGYYDDEDDLEDFVDPEVSEQRASVRQRFVAIFSTSYGISALVHVAILLILASIILTRPPEPTEAVLSVRPRTPPIELVNPIKATEDQPKIETLEQVDIPQDEIEEEVVPVSDIPKGEPDNASNKELLDHRNVDAFGVGGGSAGARGDPNGIGRHGGEGCRPETESAVKAALRWLKHHQQPDGSWAAGRWSEQCRGTPCAFEKRPAHWNAGSSQHDVGLSGLALLAFLGNGHTGRGSGEFQATVRKGLRWLQGQAAADGSIGVRGQGDQIYDHAVATMAICDAYFLTKDVGLHRVGQAAIDYLVAAQNPGLGWKYGVRSGRNDTSVTGWCVLALKNARVAGLTVPDEAFEGARQWFLRGTASNGDTGYETPGGGSSTLEECRDIFDDLPVNTGVSVLCRLLMGERRSADAIRQGCKLMLERRPAWSPTGRVNNFYYWYYGTYAMFQHGGQPWHDWNEAMQQALLPSQRTDDCANGSWDADDPWSPVGGRIYATALNALTLEIYYRYKRAQETPGPVTTGPR